MMYSFNCYGHEHITAKHKTTLEFTKDKNLSLMGDCIVGVKSDISLKLLKNFIKSLKNNRIKILIRVNGNEEEIDAEVNPIYNSNVEMVIRKSEFRDERTFAIKANKAAFDLNRKLIVCLKKQDCFAKVHILST